VVSDYFRLYPSTDGIKDGRTNDFVNENINKEQRIGMPPPQVTSRKIQPSQNFLTFLGTKVNERSIVEKVTIFPLHSFDLR